MTNLTLVVKQLEQERKSLVSHLERLGKAINLLNEARSDRGHGISVEGRARIAAAQRTRWAKTKGQSTTSVAPKRRRKLSATAIARIRAAQKIRWARWRKKHKKA